MTENGSNTPPGGGPVYLLVGLDSLPRDAAVAGWTVHHAPFSALNARLLALLRPERIACPLVAPRFDAEQLAQLLQDLGFTGWLTVIAPGLPNRQMVAGELATVAPGMRIEVLGA